MDKTSFFAGLRFWPVLLILIGGAQLLALQGWLDLHALRGFWPLILIAIGLRGLWRPQR